jgi:hypothetical protein
MRRQTVRGPYPVEHVQPRAALEPQVEEDETRPPHLDRAQALGGARRARYPKAVSREVVGQKAPRSLVILDHQDQPLFVHTNRKKVREESRPRSDRLGQLAPDSYQGRRLSDGAALPANVGTNPALTIAALAGRSTAR